MSKYDALRDHLQLAIGRTVSLTFDEIDSIVRLPASARRYEWWWANEDPSMTSHVQCKSWQEAGFDADADLRSGIVTFRRK